ncbi:uncharacterized protein LOC119092959 [Pollicipes pollicipes]|uniref:uncharacterized protein LOC119092959 n=1 Tax=Pollicipes pollicipes TaxID=41117 RepID=UPI00188504CD|nr:uncharacterized protein LOC119092959 [Pollicipes pollicipes]
MGDEPFLRSHCPGGAGCYCDGAEHVYVRERTATPPRYVSRSSRNRRTSNKSNSVETVTLSKINALSTVSTSSTASVAMASAPRLRPAARSGAAEVTSHGRRSHRTSGRQAIDPALKEYLAYSSDEEFEEFMSKPKTDYTYARSVSYNVISPERVTPPNMSRRCLHSPGSTPALDRFDTLASSRAVRSFRREVTSHVTTSVSTASKGRVTAGASTVPISRAPCADLARHISGAEGDTSPTSDLSSPNTRYRLAPDGGLYEISRGLDADSGDEEWAEMENNNVSKSLATGRYLSHETKTRWTARSVVTTLLYPFTYLWLAASGAGRRLLRRQHRPPTPDAALAAAPAADTVDYRRWMRGLSQPPAARTASSLTESHYWLRAVTATSDFLNPAPMVRSGWRTVTSAVSTTSDYLNPALAVGTGLQWTGGLYCEDDSAAATAAASESALLRQLKAAPTTAWAVLKDTAAFVGTNTVKTASTY